MTNQNQQLTDLLNQALAVPPSPELRDEIIAMALLDTAPDVPASPALQKNILAAAQENPVNNIIPFKTKPARPGFVNNALIGGLMAASLILGIWTGSSGIADNLIAAPLEMAGLQLDQEDDGFSFYSVIDAFTASENL